MGPISNPINENLEALQVPHPWEPHDLSRSGAFLTCCTKVLCGRPNFFCSGLCLGFSFCLDSSLYILGVDFQQNQNQQRNLEPKTFSFSGTFWLWISCCFPVQIQNAQKWNLKKKSETIGIKVKTPKKTMQKGRPYHLKGTPGSWPLQKKDYQMFTIKPKMVSSSRQIVGGPVLALQKSWEFEIRNMMEKSPSIFHLYKYILYKYTSSFQGATTFTTLFKGEGESSSKKPIQNHQN